MSHVSEIWSPLGVDHAIHAHSLNEEGDWVTSMFPLSRTLSNTIASNVFRTLDSEIPHKTPFVVRPVP